MSLRSFLRRMNYNNEAIGIEWLEAKIADRERELELMYSTLARHKAKLERMGRHYDEAVGRVKE